MITIIIIIMIISVITIITIVITMIIIVLFNKVMNYSARLGRVLRERPL